VAGVGIDDQVDVVIHRICLDGGLRGAHFVRA
jgi:hypothetical protein